MKIINEVETPLLHRKSLIIIVDHPSNKTPTREDLKRVVSEKMKVSSDCIIIKKIDSEYGIASSKIYLNVYDNSDILKQIEYKNKKVKKDEQKGSKK